MSGHVIVEGAPQPVLHPNPGFSHEKLFPQLESVSQVALTPEQIALIPGQTAFTPGQNEFTKSYSLIPMFNTS